MINALAVPVHATVRDGEEPLISGFQHPNGAAFPPFRSSSCCLLRRKISPSQLKKKQNSSTIIIICAGTFEHVCPLHEASHQASTEEASGSHYKYYVMSIYVLICVRGRKSMFNEDFSAGPVFVCSE